MAYTAAAAIKAATSQIGYRESGTNNTKYNKWLGRIPGYPHDGYGYPWCASFQSWCADQAGGRANVDYPRTAGCAVAVSWFRARGRWSQSPHVGDWVFYGPGGATHVELVVAVSSGSITTVGGNTSGSLDGRYYNGDGVYQKTVSRSSSRIYGYGRPAYTGSSSGGGSSSGSNWTEDVVKKLPTLKRGSSGEHVETLQGLLQARSHPEVAIDGDFGPITETAVKAVQKWGGTTADGIVGPQTWPVLLRVHK